MLPALLDIALQLANINVVSNTELKKPHIGFIFDLVEAPAAENFEVLFAYLLEGDIYYRKAFCV